jgi:glycosyltransferase involved in cell wall biosynthesis
MCCQLLNKYLFSLSIKMGKPHWFLFCQPKVLLSKKVVVVGSGNIGKNLISLLQKCQKEIVVVDDKAQRYAFSVLNIAVKPWHILGSDARLTDSSMPIVLTMFNGLEQAKNSLAKFNLSGPVYSFSSKVGANNTFSLGTFYWRKLKSLKQQQSYKPLSVAYQQCVLLVEHNLGGGTYQFSQRQFSQWSSQCEKILVLTYSDHAYHLSDGKSKLLIQSFYSLDLLQETLQSIRVKDLVLSNLFGFAEPIALLQRLLLLPCKNIISYIHDYFAICQSYTLWNNHSQYCGLPQPEVCKQCVSNNPYIADKTVSIEQWRVAWQQVLMRSHQVVVFSKDSAKKLKKIYPDLSNVVEQPHSMEYFKPLHFYQKNCNEKLTIGVLGPVTKKKGESAIIALHEYILKQGVNAQIVIIGKASNHISALQQVTVTGSYELASLDRYCKEAKIDVFLFASLCPETFSFAVSEIIAMKYPVLCFDLGAQADKVLEYKKGAVVSVATSPKDLFLSLKKVAELEDN